MDADYIDANYDGMVDYKNVFEKMDIGNAIIHIVFTGIISTLTFAIVTIGTETSYIFYPIMFLIGAIARTITIIASGGRM